MRDKRDKDTKRTSFDLLKENSELLGNYSSRVGSSYSRVINYMIRIFMAASPDVKRSIADFCDSKIKDIESDMQNKDVFERDADKKMIQEYQKLAYFFREGESPERKEETGMKKIYLKSGYVLIPDDKTWICLDNMAPPKECMYAGVVETRQPLDGKKHYNTKHYVFFCDYKYGADYPKDFDDKVYAACAEKDPDFKDILNATVTPVYDGEPVMANMTNLDEYKAAPTPGLFHIVEKGDPLYWNETDPNYEPPLGIMIIR